MKSFSFESIQEFKESLQNNKDLGIVVFASPEIIEKLSKSVEKNVVLCSTSGEYTEKGFRTNIITGFTYELEEGEVVEIQYPPIRSFEKLKAAYKKVENNENAFALLLCDGLSGMEESIVTNFFFAKKTFKIIGGSAGDYTKFKETLIYKGIKKVHSLAIFFNINKKTELVKENIYEPTGVRLLVTESDPINRVVKSFNNKPAATEYARALKIEEKDLPNYFMNNPLGKMMKNNIYISSPMKVNEDKSITFYCQIIPNTFLDILKPVDVVETVKKTVNSLSFSPSFILSIHCILRSLKFQQEDLWHSFDNELLKLCENTTGFISYGEQFYQNHFNQTMVMLAIE